MPNSTLKKLIPYHFVFLLFLFLLSFKTEAQTNFTGKVTFTPLNNTIEEPIQISYTFNDTYEKTSNASTIASDISQVCNGEMKVILKDDFGSGTSDRGSKPSFTNFTTSYNFSPSGRIPPNSYSIMKDPSQANISWSAGGDHTTGKNGDGYMLVFDANSIAGSVFYEKKYSDLCAGGFCSFSIYASNMVSTSIPGFSVKPKIKIDLINPLDGTVLKTMTSNELQLSQQDTLLWNELTLSFNIPAGLDNVIVRVSNAQTDPNINGNDVAFDDASFSICVPKVTISKSNEVCSGQNTTLTAVNENTTNAYNYQWQELNGTNWTDISGAIAKDYTTPLLTEAKNYRIRCAESGINITSNNNLICSGSKEILVEVMSKPALSAITAPEPICAGSVLELTAPAIDENGSAATEKGWYLENDAFDTATILTFADNGKKLTYKATNSCGETSSNEVIISVAEDIIAKLTAPVNPEYCTGNKDGSFKIEINGGTQPYNVSLDNITGAYEQISGNQHSFLDLAGGSHKVYIKDALGCTAQLDVAMPTPILINPIATVTYDCVNNAASNSVSVSIDSEIVNPADVDYALDGGVYQSENVFTNVTSGSHTISARHTNGCIQSTKAFIIKHVEPLKLSLTDGEMNEIVANATGGAGGYQYSFEGQSYNNENKFIMYKSGNYNITVTDKNGCSTTVTKYFTYIDVCIPNYFTPNGDGVYDEWGPDCTVNYRSLIYTIIDRYGREIANYHYGQKWDGKYNGKELPSGDYWYVLKLNDPNNPREFVGHFTLYR